MTLVDELLDRNIDAEVWPHEVCDIGKPESLAGLSEYDVVINTAAFHRLQECEDEPHTAWVVNRDGAENVAKVAKKLIHVSTDYVFPGDGPYDEVLPGSAPPSIYGQTKLMGEIKVLGAGGIVVRVSGLYGHHESHKGVQFPDLVVGSYDALHVPDDQRFSPTYAPDAARRIVDLALDPYATGIYHAAGQGSCTWADFANNICEAARHKRTIAPTYMADPLRPKNSVLYSKKLPPMRHWRFALMEWAEVRQEMTYDNATSPLRSGS